MNSEDWQLFNLADITEIMGGGTPKTSMAEYWGGDIPWISVVDFSGEKKFIFETEKRISKLGLENSSSKILKKGQIIISARGTVGELAILGRDMAFNQSCYGLNAKSLTSNEFLYYLLKHNTDQIKRKTNGAVFDTITRDTFNHINVRLPSLNVQQSIVEILSSLDDKIELNRQTNATLEAIAQAIFKDWFVDFNFPGATGEMIEVGGERLFARTGMIPKGWRVVRLGEILEIKGGTTPSTVEETFWNGDFHWATPRDLSNLNSPILLHTDKKITKEGLAQISSGILPRGTLLLSSRAPIGYLAITDIPVSINQGFIAINTRETSNLFILFWLKNNMDIVIGRANGSTFLEINKKNFREIELVIPAMGTINDFNDVINPIFEQIKVNDYESATLAVIRDALLPKLMRGEIDVNVID